jgi:uncharacterized protein YdeI (YjbR/CyaY-like superfamily)
MTPTFFKTQDEFRKWLEHNHDKEKELFVGLYKVKSSKPSMTYSESVDQALCFGWIDGITRSIDEHSYNIRFTPRRPNSIWSNVNIKKIAVLTEKELMKPAGIAAYEKRTDAKTAVYSFENEAKTLTPEYEKQFKANKDAWDFFSSQPPGYKKLNIYRIMSAKQEKTQWSRLEKLISASEIKQRID